MNARKFFLIVAILGCYFSFAQETSELVDPRDGKKYKIVTIDHELVGGVFVKRTWMAQNLNYEVDDSYCYTNERAYCEAYGRLYTFEAAVAACPEGWHVPTILEWKTPIKGYLDIQYWLNRKSLFFLKVSI